MQTQALPKSQKVMGLAQVVAMYTGQAEQSCVLILILRASLNLILVVLWDIKHMGSVPWATGYGWKRRSLG